MRQRTLAVGAGQGLRGRYRSGGLGRVCPVGFGFGDAAEGDLEAGGSELAGVAGDLAAGVALAVVVVRAGVFIAHAGVSQQPGGLQLGVAGGGAGSGGAASSGRPPVAGAFAGLGAAGCHGGLALQMAPGYRLPFLALARPLRLPDWWSCGARPAQEDRCGPVRNLVMPAPVSATASRAARRAQPGIDPACCSCSSYGASSRSITAVRSPMPAASRPVRASTLAGSAACPAVQNSAPPTASSRLADLAAGRGAGEPGQHLGVALPGDQVAP